MPGPQGYAEYANAAEHQASHDGLTCSTAFSFALLRQLPVFVLTLFVYALGKLPIGPQPFKPRATGSIGFIMFKAAIEPIPIGPTRAAVAITGFPGGFLVAHRGVITLACPSPSQKSLYVSARSTV